MKAIKEYLGILGIGGFIGGIAAVIAVCCKCIIIGIKELRKLISNITA